MILRNGINNSFQNGNPPLEDLMQLQFTEHLIATRFFLENNFSMKKMGIPFFFAILFWTEHEKNLQKKKGEELPDDSFLFLHFFLAFDDRPAIKRARRSIN